MLQNFEHLEVLPLYVCQLLMSYLMVCYALTVGTLPAYHCALLPRLARAEEVLQMGVPGDGLHVAPLCGLLHPLRHEMNYTSLDSGVLSEHFHLVACYTQSATHSGAFDRILAPEHCHYE